MVYRFFKENLQIWIYWFTQTNEKKKVIKGHIIINAMELSKNNDSNCLQWNVLLIETEQVGHWLGL